MAGLRTRYEKVRCTVKAWPKPAGYDGDIYSTTEASNTMGLARSREKVGVESQKIPYAQSDAGTSAVVRIHDASTFYPGNGPKFTVTSCYPSSRILASPKVMIINNHGWSNETPRRGVCNNHEDLFELELSKKSSSCKISTNVSKARFTSDPRIAALTKHQKGSQRRGSVP